MSTISTPSKKRTKRDHQDAELEDETPRQTRLALTTSQSSASQSTNGSSPKKQLYSLRLGEDRVFTRNLQIEQNDILPPSLSQLLKKIWRTTKRQRGILPPALRQRAIDHFADSEDWDDDSLYHTAREALGPVPSFESVENIVRRASICDEKGLDEAGWCQMVHWHILDAVTTNSFELVPCSTASILPRYRIASPSRMVDYAIIIKPPAEALACIRDLNRHTYGQSVNHTDFPALCEGPIVLSIEVKRTTDAADKAKLQLAVWLAAQWKKLQNMSHILPDFLLAIWIQGHNWSIVVTTRDNEDIIIWTKLDFGDTGSVLGVYQIDWTLRYILNYIREEYWPWLQEHCLGLSQNTDTSTLTVNHSASDSLERTSFRDTTTE